MEETALGQLAAALAEAQGEIQGAKKDGQNPHFRSRYATLASVWDVCRKPLSTHGLAVTQTTEVSAENVVILVTCLIHKSGGSIVSRYPVVPQQNTPQGYGSALTYARRYSLAAIVGVAPDDDDDGEAAEKRQESCAGRYQDAQLEIMIGVGGDEGAHRNEDDGRNPFSFFHLSTGEDLKNYSADCIFLSINN